MYLAQILPQPKDVYGTLLYIIAPHCEPDTIYGAEGGDH